MQYSKNLISQQISETEFLLRVIDSKLAEELIKRLPSIFGRYIEKPELIMSNGIEETHFKILGMDTESFERHLNTLTHELINNLSSQ